MHANSDPSLSVASSDNHAHSSAGYNVSAHHPLPSFSAIAKIEKVKSSSSARDSAFGQAMDKHFLGTLDLHLLLCKEEWNVVLNEHSRIVSFNNREVESLRRTFASLYRKCMLPGVSLVLFDLRRAKNIAYETTARADMGSWKMHLAIISYLPIVRPNIPRRLETMMKLSAKFRTFRGIAICCNFHLWYPWEHASCKFDHKLFPPP